MFALAWMVSAAQEGQVQKGQAAHAIAHLMYTPDQIGWSDAPDTLPPGAEMAVLAGDPQKAAPFTMRIKLPPNARLEPHTHSGEEHMTVISGALYLGFGEQWEDAKLQRLPAGSFLMSRSGSPHFARCGNAETVIQINAIGPWSMTPLRRGGR